MCSGLSLVAGPGSRAGADLRQIPFHEGLQLLNRLEVGDAPKRHIHPLARLRVAVPTRPAAPETGIAEAAELDILPLAQRLRDPAEQDVDDDLGALLRFGQPTSTTSAYTLEYEPRQFIPVDSVRAGDRPRASAPVRAGLEAADFTSDGNRVPLPQASDVVGDPWCGCALLPVFPQLRIAERGEANPIPRNALGKILNLVSVSATLGYLYGSDGCYGRPGTRPARQYGTADTSHLTNAGTREPTAI